MIVDTPCPHCDGPVEIVADGWDRIGEGWIAWAHCPRCGARGPVSSFHPFGFAGGAKGRATAEAAARFRRGTTTY